MDYNPNWVNVHRGYNPTLLGLMYISNILVYLIKKPDLLKWKIAVKIVKAFLG